MRPCTVSRPFWPTGGCSMYKFLNLEDRMRRFPWKKVLLIALAAMLALSALLPLCYTVLWSQY